ncbi:MAG: nitroreductase family protein [Synergistaceae bacterium]|nr:nitroreductase family protein [Synergistaceae bacterium]
MKDFYELAQRRQSCRNFKDKAIDGELLVLCVKAASLAPSACNSQPWKFVIVTNDEKRGALAKLVQEIGLNKWAEAAPAFIVVAEEAAPVLMPLVVEHYDSKRYSEGDVGMATAYLILEAAEQGLGCCVIGTFNDAEVKALLGLPEGDTVRAVVAVGYAADESVRQKKRKDVSEIAKIID